MVSFSCVLRGVCNCLWTFPKLSKKIGPAFLLKMMTDGSVEVVMTHRAASGDVKGAITAAEAYEFDRYDSPLSVQFFQFLASSYLIVGDLCSARFALKRAKALHPHDAALAGLQCVLQDMWDHRYAAAVQHLASISGPPLDPFLGFLRDTIILCAVRRAAASTSADEFSIATSIDASGMNVSPSTVETLVARAGGLQALIRQPSSSSWGSKRVEVMQQVSMGVVLQE